VGVERSAVVRNHTLLAAVVALFVVAAPAAASGTPAAVGAQAAENGTADDGELAPGVYENGTVNTTVLYRAHSQELLEEGYRTSESLAVELNGSDFVTADTETTSDGENVSATTGLTAVGVEYDISKWSNESQTVVRFERDDNVTYRVYERGPPSFAGPPNDSERDHRNGPPMDGGPGMGEGPPHHDDGHGPDDGPHRNGPQMGDGMGMQQGMSMHHGMMAGGMAVPGQAVLFLDKVTENFTVENETTVDDRTAYTLTAPVEVDEEIEGEFSGDVTLVVDEDGVVHSADVTVDSEEYDSTTEYSLELEELGVDTVEEPDWLDEVPENATVSGPPEDRPGDDGDDDEENDDGDENEETATPEAE